MSNYPINRPTLSLFDLSSSLVIVLSLALGLYSITATAQVVVTDPVLEGQKATSNAVQGLAWAKQILQWEEQVAQTAHMVTQLQNMATKIESLGSDISLTPKSLQPLTSSEQDQLVEQACPGAPLGGIVSGVISEFLGNSGQSIVERQQLICKEIVLIQVDEYNITAIALGDLTAQQSTVQKLGDLVSAIKTFGESSSTTSQAQQYIAKLQLADATWKEHIDADDSMIAALEQQQSILGHIALKGSNTIVGQLVQAAAFAAAFQ